MTGLYKYGWGAALALWSLAATAQPRVETKMDTVRQDGFYRVAVTPALAAYARPDLADLRIRDGRGEPVPYRHDTALYALLENGHSAPVALLQVRHDSDRSVLVFAAPEGTSEGFNLVFNNSETQRRASISGSNDRTQWYNLRANFNLTPKGVVNDGVLGEENIHYPHTDYRYLRLEIFNGKEAPLEPRFAYTSRQSVAPMKWENAGPLRFAAFDSSGATFLRIENPGHFLLEQLNVMVAQPRYFARNITLTDPSSGRVLAATAITETQRDIPIEATKATKLLLRIEKGDNPSLQVDRITGQQRAHELLVYLVRGLHYTLAAGDSNAKAPAYDLSGFRSQGADSAQPIGYGPIRVLATEKPARTSDNRTWIWIALGAGLLVLGWFSYSLLRDVRRERRNPDSAGGIRG